ncbi:HhH-GPD domain-containing protein [Ceratobasidium sp. AG-Ba]|nr:HhH-GPD domain-containing protein [Ceratobasidium sp. AG-Ba]
MVVKGKKATSNRGTPATTPARIATTSPYFSTPPSKAIKRKAEEDEFETSGMARSAPSRLSKVEEELQLTTSPYFAQTPVQTPAVKLKAEAEEEKKREKKRRRLMVRGDSPPEYVPHPPSSPFELAEAMKGIKPELVQERVRDDPWKIIVATTMLNKTNGKVALPVYWSLLEKWPNPLALAQASAPVLTNHLRAIGTQSVRTERLIRLSNAYTMHPPKFSTDYTRFTPPDPIPRPAVSTQEARPTFLPPRHYSPKEYKSIQNTSAIAHIPFAGPYAIDSFRIFSPSLPGGGAPSGVDNQLSLVASLCRNRKAERDDFDETPEWYEPELLSVQGDDDAEWRQVRPDDKQLRRYLVWRWAIEGVAYHPENGHMFEPASWLYLNHLIRS